MVSDKVNLFLLDEKSFNKTNLSNLHNINSSQEKLFISLSNKNKKAESLPLNFPIKVKVYTST